MPAECIFRIAQGGARLQTKLRTPLRRPLHVMHAHDSGAQCAMRNAQAQRANA